MNNKTKKIAIITLPAVSIILATLGLTYMFTTMNNKNIDNSKLYIGIPKQQENRDVELVIDVTSNNGVNRKVFNSKDLDKLSGQSDELVFYDYGSQPLVDTNFLTIGDWLLDEDNVIQVKSVALDLIESAPVQIDKSGIWFINVAPEDGSQPEVSHSYCYEGII